MYGASSFSPETVKEPGHAAAGVPIVTGAVRIVATGVGEVVAHRRQGRRPHTDYRPPSDVSSDVSKSVA